MTVEDLRTERECSRCGYRISPGYVHEQTPGFKSTSHVMCTLKAMPGVLFHGPLAEVVGAYLDEQADGRDLREFLDRQPKDGYEPAYLCGRRDGVESLRPEIEELLALRVEVGEKLVEIATLRDQNEQLRNTLKASSEECREIHDTPKREWVVGFLFDNDAQVVVLIRKNRPEWQKGKLNGVGGKVEPGESIFEAMDREFEEETGVRATGWHHFVTLHWEQGLVHFLRAFADPIILGACRTTTDEGIERHDVYELAKPGYGLTNLTPNLLWLIPLATHGHDSYEVIQVVERWTDIRKTGRGGSL